MKPRSMLTPTEVEALWSRLERQLDSAGLPTQPEVAGRVLQLVSDASSHLRDFANVIKSDAPLSGRLLRFANSAHFAQRQPVTNLERACVLLGLERLKAVSLGFFLSRAAATDPEQQLSRAVWGESVYRACLAAELAKDLAPSYAPEAFVIGLMLDAGIPLMYRLAGQSYLDVIERCDTPSDLYAAELQMLPFTHTDVAAALTRRWKLPELLTRPIVRHHIPARNLQRDNSVQSLQRIAWYVGAISLSGGFGQVAPIDFSSAASEHLPGLTPDRIEQIVRAATNEYAAMHEVFREVADSVGGLTEIALTVQQQLVAITDEVILEQLRRPSPPAGRFSIAGHRIEIEVDGEGRAVAYLNDASGSRLLSYTFNPSEHTAARVLEGLGLEAGPSRDAEDMDLYLRSVAA